MKSWIIGFAAAAALSAQDYQRHYFTVGGGAGAPSGILGAGLLDTSPAMRSAYGYRFHRYFQIDAGLDVVFHAAKIRDFYESQFGDLRIRDYQYLVPVGGRAIVPLFRNRLLLHGGGGGAYMRYQEVVSQPFRNDTYRVNCPVCGARSGFGYYAQLGASVAVDGPQRIRLGTTVRVYRGDISGDRFGPISNVSTSDTWVVPTVDLTFSF